jgi:putative lipase involved disintegration of autophagic bodies
MNKWEGVWKTLENIKIEAEVVDEYCKSNNIKDKQKFLSTSESDEVIFKGVQKAYRRKKLERILKDEEE